MNWIFVFLNLVMRKKPIQAIVRRTKPIWKALAVVSLISTGTMPEDMRLMSISKSRAFIVWSLLQIGRLNTLQN